jgi:uncharacterized membrane protein
MSISEQPQEHQVALQVLIGNLLRIGVILSALFVASGGILYLMQNGNQQPMLHTFQGEPDQLTHIPLIMQQALQGNSRALIQAGLVILIFTPISRVVFSVVVFALEKDKLYVGITLLVLLLMLYSLLGGKAA